MKIAISLPSNAVVEQGEQLVLHPEMYDPNTQLVTVLKAQDGMIVFDVPEDFGHKHVALAVGGSFFKAELIRPREIQCANCDKVKLGFFEPWECIECQ